ncbi:sulfate permease [Candidatus Gracilibacteria bacterium]|nr:sulfate permease [Candidatus Gracilibacteria bacterium]
MLKFFPFLVWIHELKNPKVLKRDVLAGLSVSFILIPQSMAYAQLAGLPIEVGLYTACIPVIIAALFGSSPQMSTGPVTIVSLMTATILAPMATSGSEGYIAFASLLAFFTAIVYLIIGTLRLGVIVDFLSHPVIVGFTNAAAILTITSQLGKIFGVSSEKGSSYIVTLYNLGSSIVYSSHIPTLICGIGSILFLIFIGKYFSKIPKVLFLLLFSILISYIIGYNENYNGAIVGFIPAELPSFSLNFLEYSFQELGLLGILRVGMFSIIIGLIGFTGSISVAKFVSYTTKKPLEPNRELIGQGLANLSSSFFGGYGVAGSFSKTAVNIKAGATTGLTSVVTGAMVGITLLFFTPMISYLPIATLAAIIIVAVSHMIRFSPLHKAWKIEKHDAFIGYITFITTLAYTPNIELGVLIGVMLSLVLFIYRSMRPKVIEVGLYKDKTFRDIDLFGLKTSKDIGVYRFDGSLYFANAGYFESRILNYISQKKNISIIILDFEWVNNIDSSAEEMLGNLVNRLKENNIKVYITGIRTRVFEKLSVSGFVKKFGNKRLFRNIQDAMTNIQQRNDTKIDLSPLLKYKPDKKKTPELEKRVIKKIEKISD